MYSFYGGKQGRTYKLVQHYDSIYQMVQAFQQGGSYNTVNYGEYVIIDTIANAHHYSSPENGVIYRRGMNYTQIFNPNNLPLNESKTIAKEDEDEHGDKIYYVISYDQQENEIVTFNEDLYKSNLSNFIQNPGGGAEYVGQIVGPKGEVPELSILSWDDFLREYQSEDSTDINKNTLDGYGSPGATFLQDGSVDQGSIIDYIKYGYLDLIDQDGNITGAYIAMDIPYPVFKYHAESIEPYDEGYAEYDQEYGIWRYTNLISEDEISQDHHYYWQYDIKVPKAIQGQDLEEFDIDIDPTLVSQDGNDILPGEEDNNYRYYRIYRNYQRSAQGETTKEYLDSWQRTIHKITNDGHFPDYQLIQRNTQYEQGDTVYANGLKSHLYLYATNSGTTSTQQLPPLFKFNKGKVFTDGTVEWQVVEDPIVTPKLLTIHYTHGDNDQVKIRVLDDIICDENNGRIYVKYSDLDSLVYLGENQNIIGVDYIDTPWIDPNGTSHTINRICIKYNTYNYNAEGQIVTDSNFSLDSQGNLVFPTTDINGRRIQYVDEEFRFLNKIQTHPNTKEVVAYYNDGTSNSLGILRSIADLYVSSQGNLAESKYWVVEYNNQLPSGEYESDHINQSPLNEIACIQQYGDNIIILYSDPQIRQDLYRAGIDYALPNDLYQIPYYDRTTGNDDGNENLYWINLGSIYHSNHVFGKFDSLSDLENDYPFGFEKDTSGQIIPQHKDHAGWIATVKDSVTNAVKMYAYDYHGTTGWYELQDLSAVNIDPEWLLLISKPDSSDPTAPPLVKDSLLNDNGYWFVVSERAD